MKITTVLFDLDGTLLPMDQDTFIKAYFSGLSKKASLKGYKPEEFIKTIWAGTGAMIKNSGEISNEQMFWNVFTSVYGKAARADEVWFEQFYENEFQAVQNVCGFNKNAANAIAKIKTLGFRTVLATNPLFPPIATKSRIKWAGLNADDFELITTYDNSHFCKPNLEYYKEILSTLSLSPEECVMVGNDVSEDMVANKLGMKVFLLTDCLINKYREDISVYPHGGFDELICYLEGLL